MKKHGICIPEEYGSIEEFEEHLKKLRESGAKVAFKN